MRFQKRSVRRGGNLPEGQPNYKTRARYLYLVFGKWNTFPKKLVFWVINTECSRRKKRRDFYYKAN